jgi:hypothetical protein
MWKYVGDGAYLPGIPARDISDEEARERGIEDTLTAASIYRHVKDEASRPNPAQPITKGG